MRLSRSDIVLAGGAAVVLGIAIGAILFPATVYDGFVWKYFWGPIVADAANQATATHGGVVAERGYTLVSEAGYGIALGYALLLLVRVLRRFDIARGRDFVFMFVPFVVAGGLLRVVEDAGMVSVPLRYLVISPVIYLTMFVAVLGTLVAASRLERRGVADHRRVVAGTGTAVTVGLAALLFQQPVVNGWMLPATLGLAGVVLLPVVVAARELAGRVPALARLARPEGMVVLAGHLVDGAATALSIDLLGYGEKHPVAATFIGVTGTPYAFLLLKVAVIGGIVAVLSDEMRQDDPVFTDLVVLGILAVGLGPGTRNLARAMLGI